MGLWVTGCRYLPAKQMSDSRILGLVLELHELTWEIRHQFLMLRIIKPISTSGWGWILGHGWVLNEDSLLLSNEFSAGGYGGAGRCPFGLGLCGTPCPSPEVAASLTRNVELVSSPYHVGCDECSGVPPPVGLYGMVQACALSQDGRRLTSPFRVAVASP